MAKRLLSVDPLTGLKTYHEYDWKEKKTQITYEQDDVSGLTWWTQEVANAGMHEKQRKKDVWHAACIPEIICIKWRLEEGIDIYNKDHWERVRKKLNDPDYAYLRTWKGRI